MNRLLIVDNERLIVERLLDLFTRTNDLDLEIYGAYSSREALDIMGRAKIDIVISDIRMPGMSGLELQGEIMKQWPRCKIIFLTGFSDFEYAHHAIRNGSVDYILKTEGEQEILRTVQKVVNQLSEAIEADNLILKARQQLEFTRPLLQKEFLLDLVQGDSQCLNNLRSKFKEYAIPLQEDLPVLLAIGRVDDWKDDLSPSDKDLMLYAIQNIAEEYFSLSTQSISIIYDRKKILWLFQPQKDQSWQRIIRFIHGTLESLQQTCKNLLKLKLSFAVASQSSEWLKTPEQFDHLKLMLNCGLGLGQELILIDQIKIDLTEGHNHEVRAQLSKRDSLTMFLENGQKQHFFSYFTDLISMTSHSSLLNDSLRLEVYYSLVSILLSYINKWGLQNEIGTKHDLNRLVKYDQHVSWKAAVSYISELADSLFEIKHKGQLYQEKDIIKHVQWYVEQNLSGDLSLTRIGEVVGHNPQYLSRLYKQITDEGLSEFIMNERLARIKKLLNQNQMKLSDISKAAGFTSEQSFYRFFKRAMGTTPQEYREKYRKSINVSEK